MSVFTDMIEGIVGSIVGIAIAVVILLLTPLIVWQIWKEIRGWLPKQSRIQIPKGINSRMTIRSFFDSIVFRSRRPYVVFIEDKSHVYEFKFTPTHTTSGWAGKGVLEYFRTEKLSIKRDKKSRVLGRQYTKGPNMIEKLINRVSGFFGLKQY